MTIYSKLLILSATAFLASGFSHAQSVDGAVRNSVNIDKNGYATLNTPTSKGDQDFSEKAKVVAQAKMKREAKKQRDQRALPGLTQPAVKDGDSAPV